MQHSASSIPYSAGGRSEDATPLWEFPLEERILVALAHQPWASASDLGKVLGMSEPDVYKSCHHLEEDTKLVAGRRLGVTRRPQRRYVLTREGVRYVTKTAQHKGLTRAALRLTWQMTEEGATRMLLWAPMIESLYEILPTAWTSGVASPFQWQSLFPEQSCSSHVWMGVPMLMEVLWFPSGRLHAAATWRFERDSDDRYYSTPFFWTGLLPQEDYRSRSLRLGSPFIRCHHDPERSTWGGIEPPSVAIGTDEFAAFRSKSAYGYDVQVGSVDTAGALVWSAEASYSEWTLREEPPQPRSIGHPEVAAIGEGPDLVNLGGIREYRLMTFLAEFRAATRANLVTAFHMSRGSAKASTEALANRGLITSVGANMYVTQKGLQMLADRDRVNADRLVEVTYADPQGEAARRERRHDSAVAAVAAKCRGAGMPVAVGWRWIVSWDKGQLVPDLWVRVPVAGREQGVWTPLELEFSARTEKRVEKEKLRSYRLAPVGLGKSFPILVITGEKKAAKLFDDLARELVILSTTLGEFLTGVWDGPESVWWRRGHRVELSESAKEFPAHLRQWTGQALDYSKPTPEVWARLLEQEIIWSDPWGEGLDRGFPPISPQLQAEMDRRPNEGRAGTSSNKPGPFPVLAAPAPSPAPIGKAAAAQDRVPQDASTSPTPSRERDRKSATAQDRARRRWDILETIHVLIAEADRTAGRYLNRTDLNDAERLCLQRVRAIIVYGAEQHRGSDEHRLGRIAQQCLELEDRHKRAVRSKNVLSSLMIPSAQVSPKAAFKKLLTELLKEPSDTKRDATKIFDRWAKEVDDAVQTARRTLG